MPARGFDCYLLDARNNFDAVRPAPIPTEGNVILGQSQNIHISTNCYYGYHGTKNSGNVPVSTDCEMMDVGDARGTQSMQMTAKKRSADDAMCPQSKRLRQDDSSMCSLVGTRSSPSHSASALNAKILTVYTLHSVTIVVQISYTV